MADCQVNAGHIVRDAIEAAQRFKLPEVIDITEPGTGATAPVVVSATGVTGIDPGMFDAYRDWPRRREGIARLTSLDSFIAHANRFKDEQSAIFADDTPTAPSLQSVLDYHPEGPPVDVGPRWAGHRGLYRFPLSPEWEVWTKFDGERMTMTEFAAFLEDHIGDVEAVEEEGLPEEMAKFVGASGYQNVASPSRLIELSRGLAFNENNAVREVRNLQSGEAQFLFTSEHVDAAGAPLTVPNLFLLVIPVFRNGGFYRMLARLRYRKVGAQISFHYDLWRPDRVFDDAFKKAADRAATETGLPLFYGAPEA